MMNIRPLMAFFMFNMAQMFLTGCMMWPWSLVIAVFFSLLWLLFMPLWAIAHCLWTKRPARIKISLMLGIILSWSFGATLYGFYSNSKSLRKAAWLSVFAFFLVIFSKPMTSALARHPHFGRYIPDPVSPLLKRFIPPTGKKLMKLNGLFAEREYEQVIQTYNSDPDFWKDPTLDTSKQFHVCFDLNETIARTYMGLARPKDAAAAYARSAECAHGYDPSNTFQVQILVDLGLKQDPDNSKLVQMKRDLEKQKGFANSPH